MEKSPMDREMRSDNHNHENTVKNSPDGGFLQSSLWRRFQEAVGRQAHVVSHETFHASIIEHALPIAGTYFYVPRGPIVEIKNQKSKSESAVHMLLEKAKERSVGWIRIEPQTEDALRECKRIFSKKVVKAPHDMQPREVLMVDLTKTEEELLAGMKPKTRYNIRLAKKKGVKVFVAREEKYQKAFLDLMRATADRKEITPHPRAYYEKFLTSFPEEICRLFVAEYDGEVIAANLLIIFGTTATYVHGGSGDRQRAVMAPYLLQWEQMKFAKAKGCTRYDFGGIQTHAARGTRHAKRSWEGITRFKIGFAPEEKPIVFPGGFDIVLRPMHYALYRILQRVRQLIH